MENRFRQKIFTATANMGENKFRFIELLQVFTKRLPLGEAVAEIGASEPISVTDEGQPLRCFLRFFASKVLFYPHPPQFANWGTFPQGKAFCVPANLKQLDKWEFEERLWKI